MGTTIEVRSQAVTAMLDALKRRIDVPDPVLMAIGDDIVERIKIRFGTSTAPDGTPWRPNSHVTLMRYLGQRGGSSKKAGKGKGKPLITSKKPLIGETGSLRQQFVSPVADGALTVGSTLKYAAMQHFGGKRAQFPNLWGDIPARPFFPIAPDGTLDKGEETKIVDRLRQYIEG